MKDESIHKSLTAIARKSIPEDTNLWPRLAARLENEEIVRNAVEMESRLDHSPGSVGRVRDDKCGLRPIPMLQSAPECNQ